MKYWSKDSIIYSLNVGTFHDGNSDGYVDLITCAIASRVSLFNRDLPGR